MNLLDAHFDDVMDTNKDTLVLNGCLETTLDLSSTGITIG